MFEQILRRLAGPARPASPDPEAAPALAALMVRLARADGGYSAAEGARIDAALAAFLGLDPAAAAALRAEGEALEAGAADSVRFTRALKAAVPLAARARLAEAMWSVILADGVRDPAEEQEMRLAASLLGLTDVESAQARQRAGGS